MAETHPGADAPTLLHALVCGVFYRVRRQGGRSGKHDLTARAEARGVTPAKFAQIVAGDFTGISWGALEGVLVACLAAKADLKVAMELFDQVQEWHASQPPPEEGRVARTQARGAPSWVWPPPEPDSTASDSIVIRPSLSPNPLTSDGLAEASKTPAEEVDPQDHVDAVQPQPCQPPSPDSGDDDGGGGGREDDGEEELAPATTPRARRKGSHKVSPPDPGTAADQGEFVAQMRAFRTFYGDRPLREMAKECARHPKVERPYSFGAFSTIGKNDKLPKRDLVCAYIAGCGGSDTEIDQWIEAHKRLSVPPAPHPEAD